MCGITGFFSYKDKIDTKKYYDAHIKIAHRGPDDEGFIYKNKNGSIGCFIGDDTVEELRNKELIYHQKSSGMILGHRRLSIIDLSSYGHQPFSFENLYLVYNGEIYNYIELRDELRELGYSFETDSDTEVFLKAYHCWGVESFNKFNGMWASAIYDALDDTILLTRDRFGIKPIYYSLVNNNLVFGSEIKFVSSFFDKLHPNEQMVYEYLRFNYIDHTDQTLFKDILQLEPNSYMKFSKQDVEISKYWDLKDKEDVSGAIIEKKLNDAIRLRMRADVKIGSLLSGGVDSSTILGIIDKEKYTNEFQTFSAVFKEKKFSEKKYIDKFEVKNIDLKKNFIYPEADKLVDLIEELIYTQEEPFRSLAVFSQYEIYKYIKNNTKISVVLNGQGADEIFTGYIEYYYTYLIELLRTLKFKLFIKEFNSFANNQKVSKTILIKQLLVKLLSIYIRKTDKYTLFKADFKVRKTDKKFNNLLKNNLWNSLTFSALREYLRYEDKSSMRFSIESRLPFLDYKLVQSAFSLSDQYKIKDGLSKVVLRDIAKNKIPNDTLNRKDKMGFISPQEVWQKTILKDDFDRVFEDMKLNGLFTFIDKDRVYALYQDYENNKLYDWTLIWRLYCVYKWKTVWKVNEK